jgi:hypothetical protein
VESEAMSAEALLAAATFLFDLLDDIDTASDIAKGDDAYYRRLVECLQARRFEVATVCNGGELIFKLRDSGT